MHLQKVIDQCQTVQYTLANIAQYFCYLDIFKRMRKGENNSYHTYFCSFPYGVFLSICKEEEKIIVTSINFAPFPMMFSYQSLSGSLNLWTVC